MIATCSRCGHEMVRYGDERKPCDNCGGVLFFVTHLGLPFPHNTPIHQILLNIQTGEKLSDDLCDYYREKENVK